jgi:hypothetical protein
MCYREQEHRPLPCEHTTKACEAVLGDGGGNPLLDRLRWREVMDALMELQRRLAIKLLWSGFYGSRSMLTHDLRPRQDVFNGLLIMSR